MQSRQLERVRAMYEHIIVTLDGSTLAEQALPHAEEFVKAFGSKLSIVSVVEPYVIALPATPAPIPAYNIDTDLEALAEERQDYLDTIRDDMASRGIKAEIVMLRGRPADEILAYTQEQHVNLVIMTTHGRSGLSRFIYGSVAERVLHGSEVPVLLIRSKAV
jgi:nucleotide-binding universal stress UspA family protein